MPWLGEMYPYVPKCDASPRGGKTKPKDLVRSYLKSRQFTSLMVIVAVALD